MSEYLTTTEAARICRVCSRTVRKWIDEGILRGWRLGKWRYTDRAALREFMAAHGMPAVWLEGG